MGSTEKRGRGRPRKRRLEDEENDKAAAVSFAIKKQALEMGWRPLVGRYVLKEFKGSGKFLGKIVYYDSGLYRVDYEDGDCEDFESRELREIVLEEDDFDTTLSLRKEKLDEFLLKKIVKKDVSLDVGVWKPVSGELSVRAMADADGNGDESDESESDLCEHEFDDGVKLEEALVYPPLELPPSSGTIGVPEEDVSHLLSVYGFLRSFNVRLFLSPFGLDDLVGAINCLVQNSLLDAIHVALLHALKHHVEVLSADGLEAASKCLRTVDWTLLDTLTWPVHLVHYFTIMGYVEEFKWESVYEDLLKREYYSLPARRKLMILQILCDDALNCSEMREEIDTREELEVGPDPDITTVNALETRPRRVHPRYSKTSAYMDSEVIDSLGTKPSYSSNYLNLKGTDGYGDANNATADGNSDECRLCGMDGYLLCCDGCPSAYHSRCIGIVKTHIPDGPWFCPECTINKLGPVITMATTLKGAEIFGLDAYKRVFLGTCNHLLVLGASTNCSDPIFRYYNERDIPKVLQVLSSSEHHRSLYVGISKAVAEYWHITTIVSSPLQTAGSGCSMPFVNEDGKPALPSFASPWIATSGVTTEDIIGLNRNNVHNMVVSVESSITSVKSVPDGMMSNDDAIGTLESNHVHLKLSGHNNMEPSASVNQQADPSIGHSQISFIRPSAMEHMACSSVNTDGSLMVHADGALSSSIMSSQIKGTNMTGIAMTETNSANAVLFVGTSFRPYSYFNYYMHADFAASAAATLASLSAEESQVSEIQKPSSAKKGVSDISLQVKAFSTAASRFVWPTLEKKLMEVPRERCSWCHSCKQLSQSKRGCLLNSAISVSTKSALKILSNILPTMNAEGSLLSISTYIVYVEEALWGLTVGNFLHSSYRKQWRKQVEDASTLNALKQPLLELEEDIRYIALLGDWFKVMDDCLDKSFVIQGATSVPATMQKRGPSGKRNRKQSACSGIVDDSDLEKSFIWWRGGKQSKMLFQKAVLPRSMAKRSARQGGLTKIFGISYGDDSEIPKRSRQLAWRAAVERSKNTSQLALQVRYLDLHVRWSDLVCPDQNLLDVKGAETEASVFRNAAITDKRTENNKVQYRVAFGNQKHLPSRIMKNVIHVEQSEDGKGMYWFSELHVPLYLIKEYDERVEHEVLPLAKKSTSELSELQKSQLKAARRNVFLYLTLKRENLENCSCASCQHEVLLRVAVKCSVCQGFCHEDCTVSSTPFVYGQVQLSVTCKHCYSSVVRTRTENRNDSPTSPLLLQGKQVLKSEAATQKSLKTETVSKVTKTQGHNQPLESSGKTQRISAIKNAASASSSTTKKRSKCNMGLILRRKESMEMAIDFRRKNILLRGSSEGSILKPVCYLCKLEYNSNLMYIHCEYCNKWCHADAVGVDESKLSDVIGFKCCRCRRIRAPDCPYSDRYTAQPKIASSECDSGTNLESKEWEPATPMYPTEDMVMLDDTLFSLPEADQNSELDSGVDTEWNTSVHGPRKLPVRKQVKHEDAEYILGNYINQPESSFLHSNNFMKPSGELPCAEWNLSTNGFEGETTFNYEELNYENMEFEPQTYFSLNELLTVDDGIQSGKSDGTGNQTGNSENVLCSTSQYGASEENSLPCNICLQLEPAPELFCEICCLLIHGSCSPWEETSVPESNWRCGNCRDWR